MAMDREKPVEFEWRHEGGKAICKVTFRYRLEYLGDGRFAMWNRPLPAIDAASPKDGET